MARLAGFAASLLAVLPGSAAFAHTAMQPHMHGLAGEVLPSPAGALVTGLAAVGYVIVLACRLLAARHSSRVSQPKQREP